MSFIFLEYAKKKKEMEIVEKYFIGYLQKESPQPKPGGETISAFISR
jgi:hypothetical protein